MKYGFGREARLQLQYGPICNIGSKSSSSAATTSTVTNSDKRASADNSSSVFTLDNSNGNVFQVSQVDHGAVAASMGLGAEALSDAFSFGKAAVTASQGTAASSLNANVQATANALNSMDDIAGKAMSIADGAATNVMNALGDAFKSALNFAGVQTANSQNTVSSMVDKIDSAFSEANSSMSAAYQDAKTGNQRLMIYAAFGMVGVVVIAMMWKKG